MWIKTLVGIIWFYLYFTMLLVLREAVTRLFISIIHANLNALVFSWFIRNVSFTWVQWFFRAFGVFTHSTFLSLIRMKTRIWGYNWKTAQLFLNWGNLILASKKVLLPIWLFIELWTRSRNTNNISNRSAFYRSIWVVEITLLIDHIIWFSDKLIKSFTLIWCFWLSLG